METDNDIANLLNLLAPEMRSYQDLGRLQLIDQSLATTDPSSMANGHGPAPQGTSESSPPSTALTASASNGLRGVLPQKKGTKTQERLHGMSGFRLGWAIRGRHFSREEVGSHNRKLDWREWAVKRQSQQEAISQRLDRVEETLSQWSRKPETVHLIALFAIESEALQSNPHGTQSGSKTQPVQTVETLKEVFLRLLNPSSVSEQNQGGSTR